MVANGNGERLIADLLGIDRNALRRHFRPPLKEGRERMIVRVGAVIVREALRGNINAAGYWLATQGCPEWRISETRVLAGYAENPVVVRRDLTAMSDEEIARELEELPERERDAASDEARERTAALPRQVH